MAGAFGFLVAVVLYQMQTITSSLDREFQSINHHWNFDNNAVQRARKNGDWAIIANHLKDATLKGPDFAREHTQEKNDLITHINNLNLIKRKLSESLIFTGITIAISLFLLILTPAIVSWFGQASVFPFMLADVAAACYCLWMYFPLVRNVAK